MNQICIAKKVSQGNVDYLDFALSDDDKLMVWEYFKEATQFLKNEVGENSEELLKYIITTVEAHKDNPYMNELVSRGVAMMSNQKTEEPELTTEETEPTTEGVQAKNMSDVECYFLLSCSQFEILGNDSIVDKTTGRQLVPAIVFLDPTNPNELVQVPNFRLKQSFVGLVAD